MSKIITELHGISPEEFRELIKSDMRQELKELSKYFTPIDPIIWVTRKEAAELIGVSLVTIYNWTKAGVINPYKIGSRVRFKKSDIEKILLNSNKRASK